MIHSIKTIRTLAAILVTLGSLTGGANASVIITIFQSGNDVTATGTGTLNLSGLTLNFTGNAQRPGINPSSSFIEIGTGTSDLYSSISGPANFGPGGFMFPSSGSGDRFGIRNGQSQLAVPNGYLSGGLLSGMSIFAGQNFSTLGIIPQTYIYTWGSGANADSLTIRAIDPAAPTAVPESSPTMPLILGTFVFIFWLHHRSNWGTIGSR